MRRIRPHYSTANWFLVFLALTTYSCAILGGQNDPVISQLETFKKHSSNKNFAAIATQEISCDQSHEACHQLHLIKGDACFQLGKQAEKNSDKPTARARYDCAITELEVGIKQTRNWKVGDLDLNRSQTYENLCEALRQRHKLEGDLAAADRLAERFKKAADEFLAVEPGNPGAIFYANNAQFTVLGPELFDLTDPDALCQKLNAIIQSLDQGMPGAKGTKYEANYNLLRSLVAKEKENVPGCQ